MFLNPSEYAHAFAKGKFHIERFVRIEEDGVFDSFCLIDNKTSYTWCINKNDHKYPLAIDLRWRLPTFKEIKTIYQKGVGKYNIDPIFKLNDNPLVWIHEFIHKTYGYNSFNFETKECSFATSSQYQRSFLIKND